MIIMQEHKLKLKLKNHYLKHKEEHQEPFMISIKIPKNINRKTENTPKSNMKKTNKKLLQE